MYKIIFEDNSIFKGGEPNNSKWDDIPNKAIKRIEYTYKNKKVVMGGFIKYCHIVKKGSALIGNFNGIMQVILMARSEKGTMLFIWDLIKGEFSTATTEIDKNITVEKLRVGRKEYLL